MSVRTFKEVLVTRDLVQANDLIAVRVRALCDRAGALLVNIVSSPGSGKTTLLERIAEHMEPAEIAVIHADLDTERDRRRIAAKGVATVQLKTLGACHIGAEVVEQVIPGLLGGRRRYVFIENIGNLICPTEVDLGEHVRVVVLSTPEGDDKVMKYPLAFRSSHVLVINKTDLLPYVPFRAETVIREARSLNPAIKVFQVSALKDEGIGDLIGHFVKTRGRCMK